MKIKMKKVYYCDFCNKHSLRPLKEHEEHCTKNPNRTCKLCGRIDISKVIEKYKKEDYGYRIDEKINIDDIREDVDGCPICILTVLRLVIPVNVMSCVEFDYLKELKEWWKGRNEEGFEGNIYA